MGKCVSRNERIPKSPPSVNQLNSGTIQRTTERPSSSSNNDTLSSKKRILPPVPAPQQGVKFLAMYDFDAISDDDLTFRKGDHLLVEEGSQQNSDWWMATNAKTQKKGYIPRNYVCKDDESPQAQDWWYNCDRKEAEKMLLLPGNKVGTFLVRESTDKSSHVLSVRDSVPSVKHYRMRKLDNGGVYINTKRTFPDVIELIDHYRRIPDGLCAVLTDACPRTRPTVHFRELEVARNAVKMTTKLGAGCFGEVWKGVLRNVIDVAVKTLKPGTMSAEAFLAEAKIMHQLRHKKLVQLIAVCTDEEPILIMTELMANGALLDYIRKDEGKHIRISTIIDMASQIADGMAFLEKENFVHRDLRAANILVGENNDVKVADFGLARILQDEDIYEATENTKFPIKWTAPEAALDRKFSVKSDVWSFGVLLYELITFGRVPYPGMGGSEVLHKVDKGYRMPKPSGPIDCDVSYYEVMLTCWRRKPEDRPTFAYLHDVFDDFMVSTENSYNETVAM